MYGEHILFSIAVAITVGAIYERKFGYALPVWIIAACAWAPDIDYVLQTIMFPVSSITHFMVTHGQLHNVFALLIFSFIVAYLFSKYKNMRFNNVFFCCAVGYATHIICDYFVYDTIFEPLYPLHCIVWSCPVILEFGSWYGIGEKSIFLWGVVFIMAALVVKYALSESQWIDGIQHPLKEEVQ